MTSWPQAISSAYKYVIVKARGTPGPDGACPQMAVRINQVALSRLSLDPGVPIAVDCDSDSVKDYWFRLQKPLQIGDRVDVAFVNDAAVLENGVWARDRNLYIDSVAVAGLPRVSGSASGVVIEWGESIGPVPGSDVVAGGHWLNRNGALRMTVEQGSLLRTSSTVTVRASSDRGVASMNVHVDGRPLQADPIVVESARLTIHRPSAYVFVSDQPTPAGAKVDVVYANDGLVTVDTHLQPFSGDDNILVESISIDGGAPIASTAPGVQVDWGEGAGAFDGVDTQVGEPLLWRNGAMRFTAPAAPGADASGLTTLQKLDLGRLALQLTRLREPADLALGHVATSPTDWPLYAYWSQPRACAMPSTGVPPTYETGSLLYSDASTWQPDWARLGFGAGGCIGVGGLSSQEQYQDGNYDMQSQLSGAIGASRNTLVRGAAAPWAGHGQIDFGAGDPAGLRIRLGNLTSATAELAWDSTARGVVDVDDAWRNVSDGQPPDDLFVNQWESTFTILPGFTLTDHFSNAKLQVQAGATWRLSQRDGGVQQMFDQSDVHRVVHAGKVYEIRSLSHHMFGYSGFRESTQLVVSLDGTPVVRVWGTAEAAHDPTLLVQADGLVVPL